MVVLEIYNICFNIQIFILFAYNIYTIINNILAIIAILTVIYICINARRLLQYSLALNMGVALALQTLRAVYLILLTLKTSLFL